MITPLQENEISALLARNYIGRIGYIGDDGMPHILPVTYYFDQENNYLISYSGEGHKIDAMRQKPFVCVEVEEIEHLNSWDTVLLYGKYEEVHGADARHVLHVFSRGVAEVIRQQTGETPQQLKEFSRPASESNHPVVYRIRVQKAEGKQQRL